MMRSLLFVPGDSERKFARARDCGADALILDLEDSVAPAEKPAARAHVALCAMLVSASGQRRMMRGRISMRRKLRSTATSPLLGSSIQVNR